MDDIFDAAREAIKGDVGDFFAGDNKYIIVGVRILGEEAADSLVDTAANAVAADGGLEDFLADNDCETTGVTGIGRKNKGKFLSVDSLTLTISVTDSAATVKTIFAG